MKKVKLLVKEIKVLSDVIKKKVYEEREKVVENELKKKKEIKEIEKMIGEMNEVIKGLNEKRVKVNELCDKVKREMNFGDWYSSRKSKFYMDSNFCYVSEMKFRLGVSEVDNDDEIFNRLVVENLDGDFNVNELIERLVKEFI